VGIRERLFGPKKKPSEDSAKNGASEGKECAVCGQKIAPGFIQCPKCGSGVFNTPKTEYTGGRYQPTTCSMCGRTILHDQVVGHVDIDSGVTETICESCAAVISKGKPSVWLRKK